MGGARGGKQVFSKRKNRGLEVSVFLPATTTRSLRHCVALARLLHAAAAWALAPIRHSVMNLETTSGGSLLWLLDTMGCNERMLSFLQVRVARVVSLLASEAIKFVAAKRRHNQQQDDVD